MTNKKKNILFIVCAYGFFWLAILLIGTIAVLLGEGIHIEIMAIMAAWTPTIALLVLFKRLYPETSLKDFYKNAFKERLNRLLLLVITILQFLTLFGAVGILSITQEVSFVSLLNLSVQTIVIGFFVRIVDGPMGEQSGWRGFLQPSLEKTYGIIKASILVGIVWGFWHAPLWFITGFTGIDLIQYIVAYMIGITSAAVIIGVCYARCRNLFVPIWIHFMFNFTVQMFVGDFIAFMRWFVVLYVFVATCYIIWHNVRTKKEVRNK